MEVHEHTNVRTLPEALFGVVTLDEYLVRAANVDSRLCGADAHAAPVHSTWFSMQWPRFDAHARAAPAVASADAAPDRRSAFGSRERASSSLPRCAPASCFSWFVARCESRHTRLSPRNADAAAGSVPVSH